MASWLDPTPSNNELCDEIDEIMKQEPEVVDLLGPPLPTSGPMDLNLDTFADLLENPAALSGTGAMSPISPASSSTDYSQPHSNYEFSPNNNYGVNNSSSTSVTSPFSGLGIGPKFNTLSINQHHHPFSPPSKENHHTPSFLTTFPPSAQSLPNKTNLHPPHFLQQQQQQPDNRSSYPFGLTMNNDQADVKRFRSASMNEGATQQQARMEPHLLDPYRIRSATYVEPSYYHNKLNSSTNTTLTTASSASSLSTDVSANNAWPFVGGPRPASSSFSEALLNQHHQPHVQAPTNSLRVNNALSSSFGGSSSFYSLHSTPNQTGFIPDVNYPAPPVSNCTLYSLNQSNNHNGKSHVSSAALDSSLGPRKRASTIAFPVEIKDDPVSPNCALDQRSEPDLWSDIDQNSSDLVHENDNDDDEISSDDETTTTVSTGFHADHTTMKSDQFHVNGPSPFWQYNVQAKGPKTKRILYLKERDPHLYREFSDPVYQIKLTQTRGQTLTKLRKGDGNDVTPNPMKLYQLGKQIRDLSSFVNKTNATASSLYHGIYHIESQSNSNDSADVKKEKNKIASRACRLRKKAQHEANKLKLHGLNEEHRILMELITSIKSLIIKRVQSGQLTSSPLSPEQSLEAVFEQMISSKYNHPVAGNTDGFVQGIVNEMENHYASKQQRSNSLNT